MITRVFLVRHGATATSREDAFSGRIDVELSNVGRAQAQALAHRLADEDIAAAYSSHKVRAVDTATIIAAPHDLKPIQDEDLREIDHGHWEGLRRADVEVKYPEEYAEYEADPFVFAPEGGESGVSVLARALPVLRRIIAQNEGKQILVVAHKATNRLVLGSLLGFDPRGYRDRLEQHPACLNILDFKGLSRARLMLFNDTSHYTRSPGQPSGRLSTWWDEEK